MARVFPAELLKQLIGNNPNVRRGRDITFYETVVGFYHAVRWSEPWVAGLLAFHVAYGALVVATRRHQNLQLAFFLFTCAAVYCAQPLNGYLHRHWRRLGFTQDYFDPRGVFISTLYSGPLLVIALAQLLYALRLSCSLLIKVKRRELVEHRKQRAKEEAAAAVAAGGDAGGAPPQEATGAPAAAAGSDGLRKRV